jgi:hypothetical protein
MKEIHFEDRVRFRLPADWLDGVEDGVGVFHPPRPRGGTLRVTTEEFRHGGKPGDGDLAAATRVIMRQTAENFVRPDDPRASDRVIDTLRDGTMLASYSVRAQIEGDLVALYMWMRGRAAGEAVTLAVFSFALSAASDGSEAFAAIIGMLDAEIRAAALAPF